MTRTSIRTWFVLFLLLTFAAGSTAKNTTDPVTTYRYEETPQSVSDLPLDLVGARPNLSSAAADTFHLAWFSFDNSNGQPDRQGWISVDRTAPIDLFWHVANATELDGGESGALVPLEGNQSLWCGVTPSDQAPFCAYATLPGYGNNWIEVFESVAFSVLEYVTVSYKVHWDSEPGYDETFVQFFNKSGYWENLPVRNGGAGFYDGTGEAIDSLVIDPASVGDSLRLRFYFTSDGSWSDEDGLWPTDGAILIDSLVITDATGTVDFQDFETESPGDKRTSDGDWRVKPRQPFGDFSKLYSGTTMLQQDNCAFNFSSLWAWIDDPANSNYACAGFPEQGAWPRGNANCDYLNNEIWSPPIPVTGSGDEFRLRFRVYRDNPLDNLQFYHWAVRSWLNGCPGQWRRNNFVYYGGQKDWLETNFSIGPYVDPGASHIQISIGALDACGFWCLFQCSATPEGSCPSRFSSYPVRSRADSWQLDPVEETKSKQPCRFGRSLA